MTLPLSHTLNRQGIQSDAGRWRLIAGAVVLGLLTGCASSGGTDAAKTDLTATSPEKTAETRPSVDHSPIAAKATDDNSEPQTDDRIANAPEDKDMTVLVLDNPELMARAAQAQANSTQVDTMGENPQESPRKPHRMKFHFGFDKHRLNDEDQAILKQHAEYLRAHPEVTVRINGHTDSHGTDEYNAFLSRLRANTAAKLLKAEGVDAKRIEVVGWGNSKPLTKKEDSAANRRLELEYLSEQMAKVQ